MSNVAVLPANSGNEHHDIIERVLLAGDLSKLSSHDRTEFYLRTCSSLGLNPLTRPFDYIKLSGREVLYAKRDCADQLRKLNRISLEIVDRKVTGDLLVVTVRATAPDGRTDEDMGIVSVKGLQGEALANAMLKATTKAKRRVTLSICGLGMLDETEIRSVIEAEALAGPDVKSAAVADLPPPPPKPAKPSKPPIKVKLHDGTTAEFARTGRGLQEAYDFLSAAVLDGVPEVVGLNNELLDGVARAYPAMEDDIAELRAAAAMMMAPDDSEIRPEPGGLDPDEVDEFGLPPVHGGRQSEDPPA